MCDLTTTRVREQPMLLAALQAAHLDDARMRPLRPFMHRLRWSLHNGVGRSKKRCVSSMVQPYWLLRPSHGLLQSLHRATVRN